MLGLWDVFFEATDRDRVLFTALSVGPQESSELGKTGDQAASKVWAVWKVVLDHPHRQKLGSPSVVLLRPAAMNCWKFQTPV